MWLLLNIYMVEHTFTNFSQIDPKSKLWKNCLRFIKSSCHNDPLYKNYLNLDPSEFLFFNGIIHNDMIVSFGGIEYSPHKWGTGVARVLTRFWIHPDYRSRSLTKWSNNSIRFSPLVLEPQIEFLKKQKDIRIAMITREGNYKNSFKEIVRLANTVKNCNFKIINGLHNICEPLCEVPDSCKQMIAICPLSFFGYEKYLDDLQSEGFLKKQNQKVNLKKFRSAD